MQKASSSVLFLIFLASAAYVQFMLSFGVVLPLALIFLNRLLLSNPRVPINLPHREFWLATARQAETINFLNEHSARFGSMLVVFLCYVHWLVLRANAVIPPSLPLGWFIGGLGVFLVAAVVWAQVLVGRFQNVLR